MKTTLLLLLVIGFAVGASARLRETRAQCDARYGVGITNGADLVTYKTNDLSICVQFDTNNVARAILYTGLREPLTRKEALVLLRTFASLDTWKERKDGNVFGNLILKLIAVLDDRGLYISDAGWWETNKVGEVNRTDGL